MKTTMIGFKTTPEIKTKARRIAASLGFGLSSLLNAYLINLIKTKTIIFSSKPEEEPSNYMLQALSEAKKSSSSPIFKDIDKSLKYLHQEAKKYASEL